MSGKFRSRRESKDRVKKEVLAAIGIDSLKKEITDELKKNGSKFEQFFKHPMVLLLLGFVFTTIIGSAFTYYYQSKESRRQQEYLVGQKYLEYKISSIDEVITAFGEAIASCHNSLKLFQFEPLPKGEDTKILEGWYQSSNNWRVNRYKYQYKLEVHFNNPQIRKTFDEIVDERGLIANDVTGLLVDYVENPKKVVNNNEIEKTVDALLEKLRKLDEKAAYLRTLMVEETRESKNSALPANVVLSTSPAANTASKSQSINQ